MNPKPAITFDHIDIALLNQFLILFHLKDTFNFQDCDTHFIPAIRENKSFR